jgi:hypothetical protein
MAAKAVPISLAALLAVPSIPVMDFEALLMLA